MRVTKAHEWLNPGSQSSFNMAVLNLLKYDSFINKKIGLWTILSFVQKRTKDGNRHVFAEAKCDCGTSKYVAWQSIRNGISTSCGCSKSEDITGQKFWNLTAVRRISNKTSKGGSTYVTWLWLCDCGTYVEIILQAVKSGNTKACGCLSKFSLEKVKEKIKQVHGDTVTIESSSYVSTNEKAKFFDKEYGTFSRHVYCVFEGARHPKYGRSLIGDHLRYTKKEIDDALKKVHGDLVEIDFSTFKNSASHSKFIDKEFGEWWASLYPVLKGHGHPKRGAQKKIETCKKKYGFDFASQNKDVSLKSAKGQKHAYELRHWNTDEQLIAYGSYEKKVIEYFNKNKIPFLWQPQVFTIPKEIMTTSTGRSTTYRPDCFLTEENLWIEIKGWMRDDAKIKWEWFTTLHPNSQLWDTKKLKKMNIL